MYKVLLVDDEPWVLEGIKRLFNWEQEGFTVIGQTTRSAQALEIIQEKTPDVVFTDIRMPKISGIELMQKVRELKMSTEFIIISGYSEFSYAQEAIRLGAFDYCLKPIEEEYTKDLLKKLFIHLENKRNLANYKIIEAINNKEDLSKLLNEHGLSSSAPYYQAVIVHTKDFSDCKEIIFDESGIEGKIKIKLGRNKYMYLLNTHNDLSDIRFKDTNDEVYIGISEKANLLNDVLKLYYQADIAAAGYFIYPNENVFKYIKKDIEGLNQLINKFNELLGNDDAYEVRVLLESVPEIFIKNMLSMEEVVYFWNKVVAIVTAHSNNEDFYSIFEFMDFQKIMNQFENINVLCECILNDIDCLLSKEEYSKIAYESMNVDFQKLLTYVKEHFSEQMYLRDLSKMFYINQTYCCNLFKKYTGSTFTDYINNLRIEKSKELLKYINLTIEEVSLQAGYNDYYYFNKLFKKYYGITPTKYRKDFFSSKT